MKVLSLFDGMSCGRIALDQLGIPVEKYYASEIDKYAMQVSAANYPDIEQVGDICNLDPKDYQDVDLMLAGSPCQGFSFAGKQLAFDDPRSALFFEFIRLLKAIKPKYFLLENVRMKKEFLEVITQQLSQCYAPADVDNQFKNVLNEVRFEPIFINSSLLSAQSRQRYYWTNIPGIKQPEDKGIVLRDILETEPNNFTKMSDKFVKRNGDRNCMIDQNKEKASNLSAMEYVKNGRKGNYLACDDNGKPIADMVGKNGKKLIKENLDKAMTITARDYKGFSGRGSTGVRINTPKQVGVATDIKGHDILKRVYSEDAKSPTITAHAGKGTVPKIETKPKQVGVAVDINGHDILKRVYSPEGKSPTVNTCQGGNREPKVVTGGAFRGRAYDNKGKRMDRDGSSVANKTTQMLELRKDDKSNAITTVGKDSVVVEKLPDKSKVLKANYYKSSKANFENDTSKGGKFSATGVPLESKVREKSKTVRAGGRGSYDRHEWDSVDELHWRKLTPLECERLQTVPDDYTNHVSNTQRYKMLGNGWTVEVIKHILQEMEYENDSKS